MKEQKANKHDVLQIQRAVETLKRIQEQFVVIQVESVKELAGANLASRVDKRLRYLHEKGLELELWSRQVDPFKTESHLVPDFCQVLRGTEMKRLASQELEQILSQSELSEPRN